MRQGLSRLAGITLLWLAGLNIGGDCLSHNGVWHHITGGNFHHVSEATDIPLHSPNASLLWGLCKETLKESTILPSAKWEFTTAYVSLGTHVTYNFLHHLNSIKNLFYSQANCMNLCPQNFAYVTAAVLSWHVQKFARIRGLIQVDDVVLLVWEFPL